MLKYYLISPNTCEGKAGMAQKPEIIVCQDAQRLAETAADLFCSLADESIHNQGRFNVSLAGGSTPRELYTRLARPPFTQRVNWQQVHFFWGDERCVPPDHADSNQRMTRLALLNALSIPSANVHPIRGDLYPLRAAAAYEADLRATFPGQTLPRFDLILLGMGDDGHAASLFPGSPALAEKQRWAVAVEHTTPPPPLVPRVSLTLPVINAAAVVVFLVAGAAKAARLAQVLDQPGNPALPASLVQPTGGRVIWLVDQAARTGQPLSRGDG